jgi:hypothetical protein
MVIVCLITLRRHVQLLLVVALSTRCLKQVSYSHSRHILLGLTAVTQDNVCSRVRAMLASLVAHRPDSMLTNPVVRVHILDPNTGDYVRNLMQPDINLDPGMQAHVSQYVVSCHTHAGCMWANTRHLCQQA